MAAACLVPNSYIELQNISLNPTRLGFLKALNKMGANITTETMLQAEEPAGSILAKSAKLRGIEVTESEVQALIDELPILAIVATQAHGTTTVRGAQELKFKESNRITAIVTNLQAMGANIQATEDGFIIQGPTPLAGTKIQTFQDHRMAMAFSIAGPIARGDTVIDEPYRVRISYPYFYSVLGK
jgi:3-phosphoshikimate 1-carboxyvinyltransferase